MVLKARLHFLESRVEGRAAVVEEFLCVEVVVGFTVRCGSHLLEPTKQVNLRLLVLWSLDEPIAVETSSTDLFARI